VTPVTPAPQAAAPAPAPVQAAPAPVQVAAASPAPKPAAAPEPEKSNVLKLLSNPAPKYPTAAARAGITEGAVSARLHIEPDGRVSQVEILKARPTKVFDKEVIAAASQWKYAPIAKGQTIVTEFNFKYDN
jgi:protein TonB